MFDESQQLEVFPTAVDLKRIDLSLNMRRFYRMSVQPDLFGGVSLVREWGRVWTPSFLQGNSSLVA